MTITKSNYNLPEREKKQLTKEEEKKQKRQEYEQKSIKARGAKGSFVVFREEGLEDVFVADEL
tara:strand:+ start:2359 stop:2547 length:189 start_codon:yes stop_codon:yes gene_type:complete